MFIARMFGRIGTEKIVDIDYDDNSLIVSNIEDEDETEYGITADEYCARYVNMEIGDISFVEISKDGKQWRLYKVERVKNPLSNAFASYTTKATEEMANKAIRETHRYLN